MRFTGRACRCVFDVLFIAGACLKHALILTFTISPLRLQGEHLANGFLRYQMKHIILPTLFALAVFAGIFMLLNNAALPW